MFCTKCGSKNAEGAAFCHMCGTKVLENNAPDHGTTIVSATPAIQPVASITQATSSAVQMPPTSSANADGAAITDKALGLLKANMSHCANLKDVLITPKGLVAKGKISNHTISFQYGDVHVKSNLNMVSNILSWAIFIGLFILIAAIVEVLFWEDVVLWLIWIPCIIIDFGIWQFLGKQEAKSVHPFIFSTLEPLLSEDGVQTLNTAQPDVTPAGGARLLIGFGIVFAFAGIVLSGIDILQYGYFELNVMTGFGLVSIAIGAFCFYLGFRAKKNLA